MRLALALLGVVLVVTSTSCSRSKGSTGSAVAGVESLMADAEAHRINPPEPVRVTGVVTNDDGERRIAFLADGKRAIAVHTGPAV